MIPYQSTTASLESAKWVFWIYAYLEIYLSSPKPLKYQNEESKNIHL